MLMADEMLEFHCYSRQLSCSYCCQVKYVILFADSRSHAPVCYHLSVFFLLFELLSLNFSTENMFLVI